MDRKPPSSDWRSTPLPPTAPEQETKPSQPSQTVPTIGIKIQKPRRRWLVIIISVIIVTSILLASVFVWYQQAITPVESGSKRAWRVKIEAGETVETIASKLKNEGLIRDAFAFQLYSQFTQSKNGLQAGTYILSPSQSVPTIVDHLVKGKVDAMMIAILPGETISDIQKKLQENYGFSPGEVEAAFTKDYSHPLLAAKPKNASLEGYIYPESYEIGGGDTLESLMTRVFDLMYEQIKTRNLDDSYKKRGLTLHQGIILASIVQKEVNTAADMNQAAQVFYKRLKEGMELGADSTFIYGAELLGVEPTVSLRSPYNTRVVDGLPPGPIANPGLSALRAVAHPAKGDFLYFVSGDDGTTYFSRTVEEHEAKTAKYCHENCNIFSN